MVEKKEAFILKIEAPFVGENKVMIDNENGAWRAGVSEKFLRVDGLPILKGKVEDEKKWVSDGVFLELYE